MTATEIPQAVTAERTPIEAGLDAEVARIAEILAGFAAPDRPTDPTDRAGPKDAPPTGPGADLAQRLGLSPFERDVVMACAAVELDGTVAALVRSIHQSDDAHPTMGLALAALPNPHWDAISTGRPLRFWRLVTLSRTGLLADRHMQLDERVLNHILGLGDIDTELAGIADPMPTTTDLFPSTERQVERIAGSVQSDQPLLLALDGVGDSARRAAGRLAVTLGAAPMHVGADGLPGPGPDLGVIARSIDREWILARRLPILTGTAAAVAALADRLVCPLVLAAGTKLDPTGVHRRRCRTEILTTPKPVERRELLTDLLDPGADQELRMAIDDVSERHWLGAPDLRAVAGQVRADTTPDGPAERLYRLGREHSRAGLDDLAQRIDSRAGWGDLVLPPGHLDVLADIVRHVRNRTRVYDTWGFANRTSRGMGITALFAGESGTGKTLAAEVIANELDLDLYRVDLSATISKYIGETEKNLARLFEAAEGSGAVLLFDEADALFGRRTEVKDSHDRYANLEVAYLLQRMETYRGLAVLTTNLRTNLDRAFVRRLRFVVQFPFPDEALRAEIWRRVFPADTPLDGLDPQDLAKLTVPGGSIWSIAMSAAFAAADTGSAVNTGHVIAAAHREYAKSDRTLTAAESEALR